MIGFVLILQYLFDITVVEVELASTTVVKAGWSGGLAE